MNKKSWGGGIALYYVGNIPFEYSDVRHYGVLGMKWGIRKNPEYQYKSHGTKKWERKINRLQNKDSLSDRQSKKLEQYKSRHERSQELDRREQEYAKRVKTGGNLVSRYLTMDAIGGKSYQRALAVLGGSDGSGRKGITKEKALAYFTQGFSVPLKALYVRGVISD